MRERRFVFALFFASTVAHGSEPTKGEALSRLENLRRELIVARVVLDAPQGPLAKKCALKPNELAHVGAALELEFRNKLPEVKDIVASISPRQLATIRDCRARAACSLYAKILEDAKDHALDAEFKKALLDAREAARHETAASFRQALPTVPSPCQILKRLKESKSS